MKIFLIRHTKIAGDSSLVQGGGNHIIVNEETKSKAQKVNELVIKKKQKYIVQI